MSAGSDVRRGVLMIDLMVAMGIIGVVLLAVLPTMRSELPLQLVAGSSMLAADIEYAQTMTLTSPSDPTVVVIDPDGRGYHLALLSEPDVPIQDTDGLAWERLFGEGSVQDLGGCSLTEHRVPTLPDGGQGVIIFDGFARLEHGEDLALELVNASGSQIIHVRGATGSVSILADLPADLVD